MDHLPYIDEHSRDVAASSEQIWQALLLTVKREFDNPRVARLAKLLGCEPASADGRELSHEPLGARMPGFEVAEASAPARLALAGRHRFARYALIFHIEGRGPGAARLRAETRAAFPGPLGRAYRALVIGSRGHRLVVHRLLRQVETRALSAERRRRRSST